MDKLYLMMDKVVQFESKNRFNKEVICWDIVIRQVIYDQLGNCTYK